MEGNKPWIGLASGLVLGHFYLNLELLRLGEIIWLLYSLIPGKLSSQGSSSVRQPLVNHHLHLQRGVVGAGGFVA